MARKRQNQGGQPKGGDNPSNGSAATDPKQKLEADPKEAPEKGEGRKPELKKNATPSDVAIHFSDGIKNIFVRAASAIVGVKIVSNPNGQAIIGDAFNIMGDVWAWFENLVREHWPEVKGRTMQEVLRIRDVGVRATLILIGAAVIAILATLWTNDIGIKAIIAVPIALLAMGFVALTPFLLIPSCLIAGIGMQAAKDLREIKLEFDTIKQLPKIIFGLTKGLGVDAKEGDVTALSLFLGMQEAVSKANTVFPFGIMVIIVFPLHNVWQIALAVTLAVTATIWFDSINLKKRSRKYNFYNVASIMAIVDVLILSPMPALYRFLVLHDTTFVAWWFEQIHTLWTNIWVPSVVQANAIGNILWAFAIPTVLYLGYLEYRFIRGYVITLRSPDDEYQMSGLLWDHLHGNKSAAGSVAAGNPNSGGTQRVSVSPVKENFWYIFWLIMGPVGAILFFLYLGFGRGWFYHIGPRY